MRLSACLALAATFLLASPALAQKDKSVSFIDRFDQSDATVVVEAFTDAMAAHDYFGAYYQLSPDAKNGIVTAVSRLQLDQLLPGYTMGQASAISFMDRDVPMILKEDQANYSHVFDDLMVGALEDGLVPFNFEGGEIVAVDETAHTATVAVEIGPSPLSLALIETEWGDWRIDSISWEGSAEGKPWAVSAASQAAPPRPVPEGVRIYTDGLPTVDAEAVAAGFIDAFTDKDYFRAHFLMSPANRNFLTGDAIGMWPLQVLPGLDTQDVPRSGLFRNIPRADQLALDTMHDPAVVFHGLMQDADRQGVVPLDLTGAKVAPGSAVVAPSDKQSGIIAEADVRVTGAAKPQDLIFHMVQLPNEEWRLDRISWEGSLDQMRPWGVSL